MPLITSLVAKLKDDFTELQFEAGDAFCWSPIKRIIFYDEASDDLPSLLHELAHAVLGHTSHTRDLQLMTFEREAWQYALRTLSPAYQVTIEQEHIEEALDTYRDWLHARSICPTCHATGLQTKQHLYRCLTCSTQWHVNDARACALRRYITKS